MLGALAGVAYVAAFLFAGYRLYTASERTVRFPSTVDASTVDPSTVDPSTVDQGSVS